MYSFFIDNLSRTLCKNVLSDVLGHLFLFCFKVPEFLHVDSYYVKEHRSVFFPAQFRVIFKTKKNKIGLCFLTVKHCKDLYEIPTNEADGL